MNNNLKIFIAVIAVILVLVAIFHRSKSQSLIPTNITSQVNFPIFYPANNSGSTIDVKSFKYDKSTKQLTFLVTYNSHRFTFAEQASPEIFKQHPEYYPSFIKQQSGYASFNSKNGKVDMVLPKNAAHQTAIMNANGTLLFAQDITAVNSLDAWKNFMNTLEYQQP